MIKIIQRILQGIFLRLESMLNGVFGAEHNPFYFLGGMAYFMFWIILVSGFYIYAFYETGLNLAYNSVERITVNQWYFGGVMRSLHRYASDGMILFGVLHLLRNFAFDRYRGYRWFSWYTGMLVLLLIYMAGINGYWLPWDKLAQFAAVGTAELLDALPIFEAPLVRNFIEQGAVNDRFFSLLSFAHIGIPLGAFVVIWIHTQRVPEAKTHPHKQITIPLLLGMVVLSLLKPALSQGNADLDSAPGVLNFDWFYLWSYPLLYMWNPAKVWMVVGGATAFLLLIPFLGGKRKGKGEYEIVASGHTIMAKNGETILEASLRHGLHLPYVCRDGACGTCKGKVMSGTVEYGVYQRSALSDAEKAAGMALFCCAKPLTDLEIETKQVEGLFPVVSMNFVVQNMRKAAHDVMLLDLRPEGDERMQFIPGQYIAVKLADGDKRSYSITNAPLESGNIQLHVRQVPGGKFTGHVFNEMKEGDILQADGPHGTFFLDEKSEKPIIFMSGGCGFGSIKGIVEQAFQSGTKRPMALYWGARTPEDFYMAELPQQWQQEHDNFKFFPVLSEPKESDGWQGKTGLVHEAILRDHERMNDYQVYTCGAPGMVEAARDPFIDRGLPSDQYFADKFTFARRKDTAAASAGEV